MPNLTCRGCGSNALQFLGPLPSVCTFAGRSHDPPIKGGGLHRCNHCEFVFRHPLLTEHEYADLYRNGSVSVWHSEGRRRDFEIVRGYLASTAVGATILDVGCYTGNLLAGLPSQYRLFGIEPNIAAAAMAAQRGITIVAENADDMHPDSRRFDAITACDVIEHVADPIKFLTRLRSQLSAGGKLLITTGDSDVWLWRVAGSAFWYCFFPEHISFIGQKWLAKNAGRAGLRIDNMVSFNYRYDRFTFGQAKLMAAGLCYSTFPDFYRRLYLKATRRTAPEFSPPGCGASKDHLLCVMSAL